MTDAAKAWVAHASRVLAMASSPSRTFRCAPNAGHDVVIQDRFGGTPKPARETRALPGDVSGRAFTIIELLVVMAVILALAGLILGTAGYVQKKGARSRTEAEIAAMSAALESYKADNGIYPRSNASDSLDARSPNAADYAPASLYLYDQLAGATGGTRSSTSGKSYFAFKPNMLTPRDQTQNVTAIIDPFGNSYGYSTAYQVNPNNGYNPTFDLWSTGGETSGDESPKWIKNW